MLLILKFWVWLSSPYLFNPCHTLITCSSLRHCVRYLCLPPHAALTTHVSPAPGGVFTHSERAVSFLNTQSGVALLSRYRRRPPRLHFFPPRSRWNAFYLFIYIFFYSCAWNVDWVTSRVHSSVCMCVYVGVEWSVNVRREKRRRRRSPGSRVQSVARGGYTTSAAGKCV